MLNRARILHPLAVLLLGCTLQAPVNDTSKMYGPTQANLSESLLHSSVYPSASIQDAYTFEKPDVFIELPNELKEISGITLFDEDHLAAVQDERGKIYKIHIQTGELVEDDRFEDDGDFEDLVRIEDTFFILRSDGDIFEATGWPVKKKDTKKYETFLDAKHDTEGIAYDDKNSRLLIACKEYPGKGLKDQRAIYAFDLITRTMVKEPAFTIDLGRLSELVPEHPLNKSIRRLVGPLMESSSFKPSAIAIHPHTSHLFVLSSVQKLLVALTPQGDIDALWPLSDKLFKQPEGLTFLPNGDLFISNEGAGDKANYIRFNYGG